MRLTELCKPKQWKTIPKASLKQDGYPVYGANGVIGYSDSYNHENETILVGCRGTCGQINVCRPRSYVTGNAMCLDELSEDVDLRYLEQFLRAFDFKAIISGSSQPQITRQGLSKVLVPVRPLDEQRTIADNLGKLSQLENLCERQLSAFDDLVKSQFVEMFERREYPVIRLGDGVKRMHIGPFGSALKSDCFCDEVSADCVVYEQRHAIHSAFATEYRYINKNKHEELKRFEVGPGDLIISCRGTIGKVAVIPEDAPRGIIHPSLMLVSVDDAKYDVEFFRRMLIDVLGSLEQRAKGNCVKMAVKASELEEIKVSLPPLALQQQFADFVAKVDKLGFSRLIPINNQFLR